MDLYIGDRSKNFILWKVSWGQYKNKLLIWLFSAEPNSWDMAQNVKIGPKMKTEKRWYFLKDGAHRWLFDHQRVIEKQLKRDISYPKYVFHTVLRMKNLKNREEFFTKRYHSKCSPRNFEGLKKKLTYVVITDHPQV